MRTSIAIASCLLLAALAACERNTPPGAAGPAQQAGEKIDQAAAKAASGINRMAEKAGSGLEKAGENMQKEAKQAQENNAARDAQASGDAKK
jgi:predicted small secreted protein